MIDNNLWLLLALANGYFAFIGQKKYTLARIISLIACILSIMMFYFRKGIKILKENKIYI